MVIFIRNKFNKKFFLNYLYKKSVRRKLYDKDKGSSVWWTLPKSNEGFLSILVFLEHFQFRYANCTSGFYLQLKVHLKS